MSKKLIFRLIINITMTVLLLFAFAYQLTGNTLHEVIGSIMFLLFIAHNYMNYKWYKTLFKGKYSINRIVSITTNVLLIISMLSLMITGILISQKVFSFLSIKTEYFTTKLHTLSAFWGLVLISIHIGNHWNMAINGINKIIKNNKKYIYLLRIISILTAIYGIKAFIEMNIASKLFMQSVFSYWDFESNFFGFFINYLAIMGLFIFITYYSLKFINKNS